MFGQAYSPVPFVQPQYLTSAGLVANGYLLCTFAAGTTNPLTTYQTYTGTANTNPITLNSAGYPQNGSGTAVGIWLPSPCMSVSWPCPAGAGLRRDLDPPRGKAVV